MRKNRQRASGVAIELERGIDAQHVIDRCEQVQGVEGAANGKLAFRGRPADANGPQPRR